MDKEEDDRPDFEFIDFSAANNPSPMAKAIQMPLGDLWDNPWVNSIINAHVKEQKFKRKKDKR